MPKYYSTFLDALRFLAALVVFVGHFSQLGSIPRIAIEHDGVVVFFILSGYVIGYCAHERERNLRQFAVARAARVLSVAVPALVLTMALDSMGARIDPHAYPNQFEFHKLYLYLPLFLGFLSELWFLKVSAFSNTPYWSLAYEVWYYAAFASLFFLRGWRRILAAPVIILLMGPKIWLLAPLWIAGYGLYRAHHEIALRRGPALVLMVLAIVGYGALKLAKIDLSLDDWAAAVSHGWTRQTLSGSQFFLGDYAKGMTIALLFFAAYYCLPARVGAEPFAAPVRNAAEYTFSLYLFHFPILVFLSVVAPPSGNVLVELARLAAVTVIVLTLGGWCERSKKPLRRLFTRWVIPSPVLAASSG